MVEGTVEREPKHPPALLVAGQTSGFEQALELLRSFIGPERVEQLLREQKEGLAPPSRQPKSHERPSALWISKLRYNRGYVPKFFEWLADKRLRPLGYESLALLAKREARRAYEALVYSTQLAGAFEDPLQPECTRAAPNARLRYAAWLLARIAACDCWTLYGWHPRLNQPALLDHESLWYPEAMIGTCWVNGRVRASLLADKLHPPVEALADAHDDTGNFRGREGIARSWRILLRSRKARAVLFLNWRAGGAAGPEPATAPAPGLHAELDRWLDATLYGVRTAGQALRFWQGAREPEDLFMAVRYLTGWLTEHDVEIDAQPEAVPHFDSRRVVDAVAQAFEPQLEEAFPAAQRSDLTLSEFRALECRIAELVRSDDCDAIPPRVLPRLASCTPDGRALELAGLARERSLARRDGAPAGRGAVALAPAGLLAPGSSLLAQGIAWQTSIVIPRLAERRAARIGSGAAGRSLLDVRLWDAAEEAMGTEAVVPIFVSGAGAGPPTPMGGLSIECSEPNAICAERVRWLEIIGFLVGGLLDVCRDEEARDERAILRELLSSPNRPTNSGMLLDAFCEWTLALTRADAVDVLTYDDRTRRFVPHGIAVSAELRRALQRAPASAAATGRGSSQDDPLLARLRRQLAPRARQRSWELFMRGGPVRHDDVAAELARGVPFSEFTQAHCESVYGYALRCMDGIAPDGAVWIHYRKGSAKAAGQRIGARRVGEALERTLRRVIHVVSVLNVAFRYRESWRS